MPAKPRRMQSYESFSDWKRHQSARNQKLIRTLQLLIEETAPHLATSVKWGQGCWLSGGAPRIYTHAEQDHVQLGFYNGSTLSDPKNLLRGKGKYVRYVEVRSASEIDRDALIELVTQASI